MDIANQSIVAMLGHLHAGDHFAMVLFNDRGYRAKPFRLIEKTKMEAINKHILDLRPRGGVVLVKLKKVTDSNRPVRLHLSYIDRSGKTFTTSNTVQFDSKNNKNYWDNTGIRKAALLSEYVSLLKNWLMDSRKGCNDAPTQPIICFPYFKRGLINPDFRPERANIETWEQRSCPLEVSEGYQKLFKLFAIHFSEEMAALGDPTLQKEMGKGGIQQKKIDDWSVQ